MKAIVNFIKTTVVGGVVVIVPMAIIVLVLINVFNKLIVITSPLTQGMTLGPLANAIFAALFVVLVIILTFFIAGLLLNSGLGQSIKNWLENNIFKHIPMFATLQELTQRVVGIENSNFPVVEVDLYGTDVKILGIAVERLADGRYMVYTPASPMVTIGQLHIVPEAHLKMLDVSIPVALDCLSKLGIESERLFHKAT